MIFFIASVQIHDGCARKDGGFNLFPHLPGFFVFTFLLAEPLPILHMNGKCLINDLANLPSKRECQTDNQVCLLWRKRWDPGSVPFATPQKNCPRISF
jgi:hypothetical protein